MGLGIFKDLPVEVLKEKHFDVKLVKWVLEGLQVQIQLD